MSSHSIKVSKVRACASGESLIKSLGEVTAHIESEPYKRWPHIYNPEDEPGLLALFRTAIIQHIV